jgi:uncharacterized protein YbjT (DUF2867 family)
MSDAPILVTGATGRVGRNVVAELLRAGPRVRAQTRRPEEARLPAEVDGVGGDLTAPESLDAALDGVRAVFRVWTAPPAAVPAALDRIAAHTRRVVLLSSPHRTPHPFFQQPNPMARFHADLEARIAAAGLETTTIRPGMFASNTAMWWAPAIRAGDVVRWPYGTAETAPIDERDIAAVAARALCDDGLVGTDDVITGPESLTQAEQVAIVGQALGRSLRFEELTPDAFRRQTAGTWPAPAVEMLLDAWRAAVGQPAYVTSTVETVTGSPARTFREWASDHADLFRGPAGASR